MHTAVAWSLSQLSLQENLFLHKTQHVTSRISIWFSESLSSYRDLFLAFVTVVTVAIVGNWDDNWFDVKIIPVKVTPAVLQLLSFLLPLLQLSRCQFYPVICKLWTCKLRSSINSFFSIETSIMYETRSCRTYSITIITQDSEQVSKHYIELSVWWW